MKRSSLRLRRRELLGSALAAGVLSPSCSRIAGPAPQVSIVRAQSYSEDLTGKVLGILREHKLDVRGKRVVLKPNLVEFDAGRSINTHPMVVRAAYEALRSLGAADVRIAEGPGHRRNTRELAEAAGFCDAFPKFESRFTDLNLDEISRVTLARPFSRLRELYLPQAALGADLIVSIPKMKTHHWVGATLSMKNFFGLVPGGVYGWPKNVLHWAGIDECIADLHALFPRHFAIVDGIVGMDGNGPIQGNLKPAGVLVAGSDMVAVDATCCRIMRVNPAKVRYLQMAENRGQTDPRNVSQIGESIESVQTAFDLIPEWQSLRLPTSQNT
ncbi:MAG: DUF362 domain-containing protein [Acidobacteriia bacterium]|nr:DUF362 domain-containing protein [Terriglobia bacterium]